MEDLFQIGSMTDEEYTIATEAQTRALAILNDVLSKKEWMLPEEISEYKKREDSHHGYPVLHEELVLSLIYILENMVLLKDESSEEDIDVAIVYPGPDYTVIALCQAFWARQEYLSQASRPGALILAAAHTLGYPEITWMTDSWAKYRAPTLTATDICTALEVWMNHGGVYRDGSYTCCGEKARDSVCVQCRLSFEILPYVSDAEEEDLKRSALGVLLDCKRKGLFVNGEPHLEGLSTMPTFPMITLQMVEDLIGKLQHVRFRRDDRPGNAKHAYVDRRSKDTIYLCSFFWKGKDYLTCGSQPGTIILHVAQLLGYRDLLSSTTVDISMDTTSQCIMEADKPIRADQICAAFESWMNHRGQYVDGSYTCCMETVRNSVCERSVMKSCVLELKQNSLPDAFL
ncbi:uncharacterized protein [Hyperolius riggenbachi]|uniref:uncharacterized protein n=1 Tax=Hyperolius riggenbachi TaxID=752182 RepID=UPI0035A35A01